MPNITGQLVAADLDLATTGPLTHGTVTFTPYGGDSHVGGEDASLGPVVLSIPTMPVPLPIDAGDWTIRITTDRRIPAAGWLAPAFEPKAIDLTISGDVSWADIVSQVIDTPVMTPTLVSQAQAFRDQAEVFSATTEELQDAAVTALDADTGSTFRQQQEVRYSSQLTTLDAGDETARINAWLAAPSPIGVKKLVGAALISDALAPASGTYLDGSAAELTMTADLTAAIDTDGATNVHIYRLTVNGKHTDYTDASAVYAASAVTITGTSSDVEVDHCRFLGWAGAGVQIASTVVGRVAVRDNVFTGAAAELAAERTAQGPSAEVNYSAGVRSLSEQPVTVSGNNISGFAQGIVGAKNATDMQLVNNLIHDIDQGQHGIYLSLMAGRLVVSGNIITNCYDTGMKVQIADPTLTASADIAITGNVITSTGGQAIMLTNIETVAPESLVPTRRFSIVGNICTDNTRGIQVNDCENGIVALNVISDGRATGTGINIEDSTGLTITDNRITNVPFYGIRLTNVTKTRVDRNTLTNVSTSNTSSNNFGIHVTGVCAELDFDRNTITDPNAVMLYGMYLNPTSGLDSFSVTGNRVVGTHASGYGARFASATAIREYRDNDFTGVTGRVLNPPTEALGSFGRESFGAAAPTTGTHRVGDRRWNTAPAASGTIGWVCTANGTPGTWKTFGAISA